jgi:hypothetical protein
VAGGRGHRVSKTFPRWGKATVEGIVDILNLFNRTNFTEINNIFGTARYPDVPLATFGQFEQAGPPRQIQLGLRASF